jgi:probable F420-dependent oxidoreductase
VQIFTTAPLEDPRDARTLFPRLEEIGYDGAFSFEAKHDPFLPLATAAEHTRRLRLGTAIAIAFARSPMNLANLGWCLQALSGGRFVLGLGSQVRPHIERRFSMPWGRPVARMREIVGALRAIFASWESGAPHDFRGDYYTHTLMIPAFDPGPNPFGPPPRPFDITTLLGPTERRPSIYCLSSAASTTTRTGRRSGADAARGRV